MWDVRWSWLLFICVRPLLVVRLRPASGGLSESGQSEAFTSQEREACTASHTTTVSPAVLQSVLQWTSKSVEEKWTQNTKKRIKIFRYQFPVPCWRPRLETLTISLSSQAGALSPSDDMLTVVSLLTVVVVVVVAQDNSLVPCQPHLELPCTHTDCISRHKVRHPVKALEAERGTGTSYILHDSFPFFEYFNFSDKLALIEYQNNIHE